MVLRKEINMFFLIITLSLSLLFPSFTYGESEVSDNSTNETVSSSEFLSSAKLLPTDPVAGSTSSSAHKASEAPEPDESEMTAAVQEADMQSRVMPLMNYSPNVSIDDWKILDDTGIALSEANPAQSNKSYDFEFTWSLQLSGSDKLQPNDTAIIPFLKNTEWAVDGGWSVAGSDPVAFNATVNGVSKQIGTWQVGHNGTDNEIKIVFGTGVTGLDINKITGVKFTLSKDSVSCYTSKGGTQLVDFGGNKKAIRFTQGELSHSNGYGFKRGVGQGSNSKLQYSLAVNLASSLELSGDEVNWSSNPAKGFYQDPTNHPHRWGEHLIDTNDHVYIEDELEPGVSVSRLNISGMVRIPVDLQSNSLADKRGGRPTGSIAFEPLVLSDNGKGPTYNTGSGTAEDSKKTTEANSFKLLKQNSGESKSAFSSRVKSAPYQYGIYEAKAVDQVPLKTVRTIMVHFGAIKKGGNDQRKFSQLTDSPNSGKTTTKITDSGAESTVPIPNFAVAAAENAISRGFYAESDRDLLEAYFTLVYGDSNVIQGQISTYDISLHVKYPPESSSGEKSNTAYFDLKNALEDPKSLTGRSSLSNPYGDIALNPDTAYLWKIDQDTNEPLNNAKFKLQKKDGLTWTDVSGQTSLTTGEITNLSGEKLRGGIKVEGLLPGTYRFVEIESPTGYDPEESSDWNGSAVVSKEFVISGTANGASVFVRNKQKETYPYKVEHWIQKEGEPKENINSFSLKMTDYLFGEANETVNASPKMILGYQYDDALPHNVKSGIIRKDGTLVLKLYYTISDAPPFTLYKYDSDGNPMPSVDENGNILVDEQSREMKVTFDVYEYIGSNVLADANGKGPASVPDDWKKVNNSPVMTDSLGRISVPEITDLDKYYAIIETSTYPEYDLPYNSDSSQQVFWAVQLKENKAISYPNWVHPYEFDKREFEKASAANGNRFILKNRQPEIALYKVNEQGEEMPSSDKQKVGFDIYRWENGGTNPEPTPYTHNQWKKIESDISTAQDGYIANIGKTGVKGTVKLDWYAIVEKNTYSGYEKPDGYWLVATGWNKSEQKFEILEVKYKVIDNGEVKDGNDPGNQIKLEGKASKLYLTNKAKPISFIKEDGKQNPLAGVHFSFYKPKEGEAGESGSEDPEAADTKWDVANPTELISSSNTGEVMLGKLTRGDYLLVETKTLPGYQLPAGSWIITVNSYGEIETIRGRGDPLPPAFRIENGNYYLPNYQKNSLPQAGGYMRIFWIVAGIGLLGLAIIILQNRKNISIKEKGKEDGAKSE